MCSGSRAQCPRHSAVYQFEFQLVGGRTITSTVFPSASGSFALITSARGRVCLDLLLCRNLRPMSLPYFGYYFQSVPF